MSQSPKLQSERIRDDGGLQDQVRQGAGGTGDQCERARVHGQRQILQTGGLQVQVHRETGETGDLGER